MQKFFAACPKGLENLLFDELNALQVSSVKQTVAGVSFAGDMTDAMRVCLYSRIASRVFLNLSTFKCEDDTDLYMGAQGVAYEQYFGPEKTIKTSFSGMNKSIRNTQYGALRVKDAICDRFIACGMQRPNVERRNPDVQISCVLKKGEASISLDLSGTAQFWREYHRVTGDAPLKENLAAAMVLRSGFDGTQNFVDPMCGSATLLLEAAALATKTAPGLMRSHFGFKHLKNFDEAAWEQLLEKARQESIQGKAAALERGIQIRGFDADAEVLQHATENIANAGFADLIKVEHCPLERCYNPCTNNLPCVVVTNPPYGERMGSFNELIALYTTLGQKLLTQFKGGQAAVISTSPELLSCLRLSSSKQYRLYNGALECQLRVFKLDHHLDSAAQSLEQDKLSLETQGQATDKVQGQSLVDAQGQSTLDTSGKLPSDTQGVSSALSDSALGTTQGKPSAKSEIAITTIIAQDFANRLSKNLKHLEKWAKREDISAYRVYDADLPEYNAAIDRYNQFYIVQEYQAPSSIRAYVAQQRLLDMIAAAVQVTGSHGQDVIVKSREKQKGDSQYVKRDDASGHFIEVHEGKVLFKVNLLDYLDTGLFLDARPIRRMLQQLCQGKSFLNLFAYTCTASVMAALGGAKRTVSVDMSRTYLDWGIDNFRLNQIELKDHQFVQHDCLAYLSADQGQKFDVIYIDPPTFSNSKRMEKSFDVQRDHKLMLGNLTRHLNDGGVVIFCTNKRHFKLHEGLEDYGFSVENITEQTYDPDFKRDRQLHTCFKLTYSQSAQKLQPESLVSNTVRPKWSRDLDTSDEFGFERKDRKTTGSREQHMGTRWGNDARRNNDSRWGNDERHNNDSRWDNDSRRSKGYDTNSRAGQKSRGFNAERTSQGQGGSRGSQQGQGFNSAQGKRFRSEDGRGAGFRNGRESLGNARSEQRAVPPRQVKVWGPASKEQN